MSGRMLTTDRLTLQTKIDGWGWVVASLRGAAQQARDEADRLLGPDRGQ